MPRRLQPDPFALAIGKRIKQLREEVGLTQEQLACGSELGSKGHLSNIEKGLVRPTVMTIKVLADYLRVLPADLMTFPADDVRQRLIDLTRRLSTAALHRVLKEVEQLPCDRSEIAQK